jgi:hypothetical protein
MVNLGEIGILASGPRHHRTHFTVRKRSAKGHNASHNPQHDGGKWKMNTGKLKPKSRENARPYHVGDDQNGGGKKAYRFSLIEHWPFFILSAGLPGSQSK